MRWIDAALFCVAVSYFTFALLHTHIWLQRREACQNISFALLAASMATVALCEIHLLSAHSAQEMARWFWWCQFPYWTAFLAVFAFVRPRRGPGKPWLGWGGVGLCTVATVGNLFVPGGSIYSEIRAVEQFPLFGESFSVEVASPSGLLMLTQAGASMLLIDVLVTARHQWRKGDRRWALIMGGSLALGVALALLVTILLIWVGIAIPISVALCIAPLMIAMAGGLSQELGLALRLSRELRELEAALNTSRERLALAAAAARAVLWQIDLDSGTLWIGGPGGEISDREGGGRLRHVEYLFARVHPEDRDRVRQTVARMAATGERISGEFRSMTADGRLMWTFFEGMLTPDHGGSGRVLAGVGLDITDRKRAEAERDRYRTEFEMASRSGTPTEVAGALAHELNQPLAAIMSNAEAAQRLAPGGQVGELREVMEDIRKATWRAVRLVGSLRRRSRRGRSEGRLVPPVVLVDASLEVVRPELEQAGVSLVVLGRDHPMGLVRVDSLDIEQALINLFRNGCDALAANPAGDRRLEVRLGFRSGRVDIHVIDNGPGLPVDEARLFEFFFTTKAHGLGMGLPLARAAVEANRGRLTVQAAAGQGVAFTVSLPLAEPGQGAAGLNGSPGVTHRPDRRSRGAKTLAGRDEVTA